MDEDVAAPRCRYCHQEIHRDRNGYWVGADETSDCPADSRGHDEAH